MERISLKWLEKLQFLLTDEENHQLLLDGAEGKGFKPIHLFLASIAGCMGMDIASILQKKEHLSELTIEVFGQRASEHPKRFINIEVRFKINPEVSKELINQAFQLSKEKYCSVLHSILKTPEINFYFE